MFLVLVGRVSPLLRRTGYSINRNKVAGYFLFRLFFSLSRKKISGGAVIVLVLCYSFETVAVTTMFSWYPVDHGTLWKTSLEVKSGVSYRPHVDVLED